LLTFLLTVRGSFLERLLESKFQEIWKIENSQHRVADSSSGAREFFLACGKLDVELKMIHWILQRLAGDAPSYESPQPWQNG